MADEGSNSEDPNSQAKQFFDMLSAVNNPLYSGCEAHSQMSTIGKMMNLIVDHNCLERLYDELCTMMHETLPQPNLMPSSFNDTKKLIAGLGLQSENIDCCINGCMIYWGRTADARRCETCSKTRWVKDDLGNKRIPRKQFIYLPISPRLQRLYASQVTACEMRWHVEHHKEEGEICHPSDSEAWLNFNATHPEFAAETRNVRLGLYTGGFNPFENSRRQYSSWPVILTPYNLPPWMCMKAPYMFLTVIAPGSNNPKQNIDIYLQPLIEELKMLWTNGIVTYDVSTRQNFCLRAALMWTISDFSAYSMLSGWSTHGKNACPYCMSDSKAFYLRNSRKMCWFDCHRMFLPDRHPFRRRNKANFMARVQEEDHAPHTRTGVEILGELNMHGMKKVYENGAQEYNEYYGPLTGGWEKRSVFWDLPYWKTNMIRHCLDVMQIEKQIFDNIFNTILRVEKKTNDHLNARKDLQDLGIRSILHPKGNEIPMASYTLDDGRIYVLLDWLKTLRFPDGYVSGLAKNIDMTKHSIFGLQSHDCHVFMQHLIPIVFRELLPLPIWEALTELSLFFKMLTSSKLKTVDLKKLEVKIPVILCKLEKIFPPSFFDCMEHLSVHLPYEARITGPVQYRWMYPFERYLRHFKINVENKAHVEASMCNQYLAKETSLFVYHYFESELRCRQKDLPMDEDGGCNNDRSGVLSIFTHPVRFYGMGKSKLLNPIDLKIAHRYILMNCSEVEPYMRMFTTELHSRFPSMPRQEYDAFVEEEFPKFFNAYARAGHLDNVMNGQILKDMAEGPLRYAISYNICHVNGYMFHTNKHAIDNSGVCVKAVDKNQDGDDFYGRLEDIIELEYSGMPIKRATLFKCHWYEPTRYRRGHNTRVHERYQIVDIYINRLYGKYDPFVLASQASQVYYIPYPSLRQDLRDWRAVYKVKPKKYQVRVAQNNDIDEIAFQEEEHINFHVSREVIIESSLLDPSGKFIKCDDELKPSTTILEEEPDIDSILSDDEQIDDVEYFSDSG
ncbi:unnamed protein product [Amaranthus hypochondriacus]